MAYNATILEMIAKIKAIVEDFGDQSSEAFPYENSTIFTISEPRVQELVEVLINGSELHSGQSAEFDPVTNDLTITNDEFENGDIVKAVYTFSKNSNAEYFEYIRAALVFLSIYDHSAETYKLSSNGIIIPSISDKDVNLVCMIASILIKPDYVTYKTTNMQITYPTKLTKEEKIEDLITKIRFGTGFVLIAEWNNDSVGESI